MPAVIVVGSGAAGMAAAVSAAEHGADVLVVERAPQKERGGNSLYTEAYMRLSSENELAPQFREDFVTLSNGRCDMALVDTLAAEAIPTIHWVRDHGVRFDPALPTRYLAASRPRLLPAGGGAAILAALEEHARSRGVSFVYRRIARDLIVQDGKVVGVVVTDEGGREEPYDAAAVILACGGFEGSRELQRRYLGAAADRLRLVAPGSRFNQGEGMLMALAHGAQPAGDFLQFHAEPIDPRSALPEAFVLCYWAGVLLNLEGTRFVDEGFATTDAWYEEVSRAIWRQPKSTAYAIVDATYFDLPGWRRTLNTEQEPIRADTLDELVEKVPFEDPSAALRTLRAWNDTAQPGPLRSAEPDGVTAILDGVPKSNWAYRLSAPPFAAYPIVVANTFTFGGLAVTPEARVRSAAGGTLPGLFAAGETIGLYYGRYVGATSVLRGLVFGRLAGRAAARG